MTNRYWDEDEECKGERLYQTREGRLKALNQITRKYIEKTHGIKVNYKENVSMNMASIIKMIETKEFRNFALDNYQVFIYCEWNQDEDEPTVQVRKITDEMFRLIQENYHNLYNKEFQDKLFSLEDNFYSK
jgi:hypothetical protein